MENDIARIRISYAYKLNLSKEDAVKLFVHTITANPECAKLKKNIPEAILYKKKGRGADDGLIANCHRVIDSLVPLLLTDKEKVENNHSQNYLASFMAVFLKTNTDFSSEDYDVCGLAHVILRLGYLIQTTSARIKCGSKNNIPGIAVYPVLSLLQCCEWNVISYTYGTTVNVVRAGRDIAQGEQIFENDYQAIIQKTVFETERIQLINEVYVLCFHNKHSEDYTPVWIEKLKLPLRLVRRLRKSPNNIRYMWELMDFMNKNAKKPCSGLDYMKMFLEDAYMGCENAWLRRFYEDIGLW
ncbi:uncharacterized protein LOC107271815 isoform X2 [Cephus cinctus]|uniref:Uncharacterized protein LOC107271815 isoform X2 n=1 Tax=Cephus cinctus TaxID=211228 RepID=A0AAJ7RPT5_CEPCN|nr:uncharacterized protein LOC107271815 isoform X2 [Cephus cinctus]